MLEPLLWHVRLGRTPGAMPSSGDFHAVLMVRSMETGTSRWHRDVLAVAIAF